MKMKLVRLITVLAIALLFAGCGSMSTSGDGADVSTAGAKEGGKWSGSPLNNPDSPLYSKVIYFGYDLSTIQPEYRDIVIAHGQYLAANSDVSITVEGHCDERGSREYNIGLGERRANAVRSLLLAQGASSQQVVNVSYGEERPAAQGSNEMAWAKNRRAELVYGNAR
jgi:peptidoglycan-associated lipoprotein